MAAVHSLVHETTTSTGTGNLTTTNANGKRSFNTAFGTGGADVFYYFVTHQSAAEYEWGTGHLSAATTLVRDTVIGSSNSNAAVSFSAGTKDITCDIPAANQIINPLTTRGDIITRGASLPQRLALGAVQKFLRSDGTDATWGFVPRLIGTVTTTSGTTASFTGFSGEVLVAVLRGLSCSGGSAMLTIAHSIDNGSNYGTAVSLHPTNFTATVTETGMLFGIGLQTTGTKAYFGNITDGTTPQNILAQDSAVTGAVNAVQFAWTNSRSFDAGAIDVWSL